MNILSRIALLAVAGGAFLFSTTGCQPAPSPIASNLIDLSSTDKMYRPDSLRAHIW